jgi:serine/threonine protein kinase
MIGSLLKDRYQVEKELGRGGFGVVYRALDQQLLGKPVVIKILTDDLAADPWPLKKFRQEIEAMARIDHPGVVGALDTGETADGKPFLVMQFVEGVNLRGEIGASGMELGRAAGLIRQIGQALNAAHAAGVWHRDLKPENIMIQKPGDGEEYVKLIDFGIAAIKDSRFAEQSQTTKVAGSYAYMAPEQFAGNPCAQSDIWAFGVIAYEMLTGKKPFQSDSLFQLMMDQREGVPVRPRQLRPEITAAAEECVLRALAAGLDVRYQRPREFGDALAKALAEEDQSGVTAEVDIPRPDATTAYATPSQRIDPKKVEMAHVLFMDIVGFSREYMDQGAAMVTELQQIVRSTSAYKTAERNREILRLATGDGMALVFFGDPQTAAQCALEIAAALKSRPQIKLRMGINTGPVQRLEDIKGEANVSGAGINNAQRVMDAGDAGHILCSKSTAEVLAQLTTWAPHLHDLGECEVKHGIRIPMYNLYTPDVGNAEWPSRIPRRKEDVERERLQGRSRRAVGGAVAALVVVVGGVGLWRWMNPPPPEISFEYWATVQRIADKSVRVFAKEQILDEGYQIAVHLRAPAPGHLYLINKGKLAPTDQAPVFVVLSPGPKADSAVAAGREIRAPASAEHWFRVDKAASDEFLYLVWATDKVDELERIKDSESDPESNHVIIREADPRFRSVDNFMTRHLVPETQIERNEEARRSVIRGRASILVHLVRLSHM